MANTRPRFSQFVNHDVNPSVSSRCEPFSFTYENLYKCLYQRNEESTSQATAGKVTSAPGRKGKAFLKLAKDILGCACSISVA